MHPRLRIAAIALSVGIAFLAQAEEPIRVTVAIEPQAWIVERLLADTAQVQVLLPPRAGHLAFDPSPQDMFALSSADVIIRSGLPFEESLWLRIQSSNPDAVVVEAPGGEVHHDHGDHADHDDPHFWLDPVQMEAHAADIAAALSGLPGVDAAAIERRLAELDAELHALDHELAGILAESRGKEIWSFHASWGPFANHYGLVSRSVESDGKAPGVKGMLALMDSIEESGASVIFTEPGLDPRQMAAIEESTGLAIVELDPMHRDYAENLRRVSAAIVEALR